MMNVCSRCGYFNPPQIPVCQKCGGHVNNRKTKSVFARSPAEILNSQSKPRRQNKYGGVSAANPILQARVRV
ncbi:Protein of unknown function [Pyronema omphalodes CBS 100304]|uniref:Uncharacterized protein n=1 Tax=Pyronema omphalodes (strain CBS 100304) TaxID=1076935 RepID=U4LB87_PYROM|nr:Protein of unknown function [Pyronema omphalodes CBS 100304]